MKSIFGLCQKYLKKNRKNLFLYGILCLVSSAFSMISPYLSGSFIDCLLVAENAKIIYKFCLLFLIITVLGQLLGYFVNRLYTKLQTRMGFELNSDIIGHIQKLSLSYINNQDMAYLNQRINNDSNMLITFCIGIVQGIIINTMKLSISIILLVKFNGLIAILLLAIIVSYAIIYRVLKNILFKMQYALTEAQAKYFAKLYEQFSSIVFVKKQSIYAEFMHRLSKEFNNIFKVSLDYQKVSYVFSTLDSLVMSLAQIAIFIIGGIAVIKGNLTIGQLTIMLSYFNVMMGAARYFFSLAKTIQDNKVAYIRLKNILDEQVDDNMGIMLSDINKIEVRNIGFSYKEKPIFHNFSYTFEKGKIYSIIGHNGTGKSTLINLILGFYHSEYSGTVCYNEKLLQTLNCYEIRKKCFGISEQEPILLSDTIRYNIVLDEEKEIDLDRLYYIARQINLDTFLDGLPDGIKTVINEKSTNLSGGEKQKISILRAFYKNPSVIILDEPTSALDEKSSECLKKYLMQIKKEKIILIITHNQDFLSISDFIIDLDEMKLREEL